MNNTTGNEAAAPKSILAEYGATAQQYQSREIRNQVYKEGAFQSGKSEGMNAAYNLINELSEANRELVPAANALFDAWIAQSRHVMEVAGNFHDEIVKREAAAGSEL